RPDIADGVAVASGDPNNRRVLLAVFWVRRKVSGQLPDGRIIADRTKQIRGRIRNRFPVVSPPGELGLKALAGLSQRGHLPNLALWLARSTATPRKNHENEYRQVGSLHKCALVHGFQPNSSASRCHIISGCKA